MTAPSWAPALIDVGAYITSRTAVVDDPDDGIDVAVNTFTADTYPTDVQVDGIIDNVCSWVLARVGTVDPSLEELASTAAALRTAGLIQLSYPSREGDVENASTMLKQADNALATLETAQRRSDGTGPLSPVGRFPAAARPLCDWPGL